MSAIVPPSSLAQPTSLEIESARAQLVANEAELASLLAQVELVITRTTALKQIIAPVRRIPTEILSKIIVQAATAPDAPAQVLRTLGSLCKSWRQITLGTPEAWSKIHVVYSRDDPPPPGPRIWLRTLRDLQEWLDNSGNSQKDVRMSVGDSSWDDPSAYVNVLRPYMSHVRVLAIQPAFPDDAISPLFDQPLPHLEEYISCDHNPHDTPLIPKWSLAPALERLLCVDGQLFLLPRAQRKRVTRLGIASDDLSTPLNFCLKGGFPALRVLAISGTYISEMRDDAVLTLPQLEAFHLAFCDPSGIIDLFLHLKLPKLSTLSLQGSLRLAQEEEPSDADVVAASTQLATVFARLIDGSAPPLRRVFLQSFAIRDEDLFNTLKRLPAVERLLLTDVPVRGHFARLLASKSETGWVCPKLTYISVASARDWAPFLVGCHPHAWSCAAPDALTIRDMEITLRAREEEAARNPEAVTGLTHVRVYDAERQLVDRKVCWIVNQSADELFHPRIFRDAYFPFDRWWRMDEDIIGADLPIL